MITRSNRVFSVDLSLHEVLLRFPLPALSLLFPFSLPFGSTKWKGSLPLRGQGKGQGGIPSALPPFHFVEGRSGSKAPLLPALPLLPVPPVGRRGASQGGTGKGIYYL